MTTPEAITQLSRLIGRREVQEVLGPEPHATPLRPDQLAALRALVDRRLDQLVRGLAEEAAASDDVTSRAAAEAYLEERLAFFAGLLTAEQAARVRAASRAYTGRWG
ncbi:MAG TPA: hypothetical protein VIO14_01965 [Dehalococcoidia bacterium]